MQRQSILMALLTINPNRCLSFHSASLIVAARARARHRAPSPRTNLLRSSKPFGKNNYCPQRIHHHHACFSTPSATNSLLPSENYPVNVSISPTVQIIYPEQQYTLCYDGRSSRRRGEDGASGSGAVLYDSNGTEIWSSSYQYSGETSIYEASYRGLISGLQHAKLLGLQHIAITGCNELLHKQIEGLNQVKKPSLQEYYHEVMTLKQEFTSFQMNFVDKTKNERAWQLAQKISIMDHHGVTIEQNANKNKTKDTEEKKKMMKEIEEDDDETSSFIDINLDPISESMDRVNPDKLYILRFDGASSRGNPGAAGSGMVLYDIGGNELWSGRQYLGEKNTNNEAEFIGLITGLRVARILGVEHIIVQGDGPLLLRQIEGTNKVNSTRLKPYYDKAISLKKEFVSFHTSQIVRSHQNARANELANEAMNTQGSSFEVHQAVKGRIATSWPKIEDDVMEDELEQYISAASLAEKDSPSEASTSKDKKKDGMKLNPQKTYTLCFDGGSRGNPGVAGAGMVLYDDEDGTEVWSGYQYVGDRITNNEAEYSALITGLRVARSMGVANILVQGDSQLILRQIDGVYKVKSEKLRNYYEQAMSLRREFASFQTNHIERALNARADELANEAMDNEASSIEECSIQTDHMQKPLSHMIERMTTTSTSDDVGTYITATTSASDGNPSGAVSISHDVTRLDPQKTYTLCFDGGSRGNPGVAGAGIVLYDDEDGTEVWSGYKYVGDMITNNEAEYSALISGLRVARSMGVANILVQGDSQLILRQIDGVYKVKSEKLRNYYEEAMSLRREFASFQTYHIERALNARADELANEAMNKKVSGGIDISLDS